MRQTLTNYIFVAKNNNLKIDHNRIFFFIFILAVWVIPQQTRADNPEQIMAKIKVWVSSHPAQTNISAYLYNNDVHIIIMSPAFFKIDLNIDTSITVKCDVAYITARIVTTLFNFSASGTFELIGGIVNTFGSLTTIKTVRKNPNVILPRGRLVDNTTPTIYWNNITSKREFARSNITPTCGNLRVWLSPRIMR